MARPPKQKRPKNKPKTSPARLTREQEKEQVSDLKILGYSFPAISRTMKISVGKAHKLMREAIADANERAITSAEELRRIEDRRIDQGILSVALDLNSRSPDRFKAAALLVRYIDQRAKLWGLYPPLQIEHSGNVFDRDAVDDALARLDAEEKARATQVAAAVKPNGSAQP